MKKEFIEYLESIGLSKTMQETIIDKYQKLIRIANVKGFDDVFISEISSGGNREYFSLWGFTPTLLSKISLTSANDQNMIVLIKAKNNLARFSIADTDFDLVTISANSILDTTFGTFDTGALYALRASGVNCSHLLKIIGQYFIPNLNS